MPAVLILLVTAALSGCSHAPTYSKDVAPIMNEHCVRCHRPGQPVPFTLTRFSEIRPRAGAIARATATRHMPPWLPDPSTPAFAGERRLQAEDIDVIQRWVSAGAPEGNPSDLPKAPTWTDGWELGQPDVIATPPRAYILQPGNHDEYRNLVVPLSLPADRFVRAIEFRAGDAPVHHAVVRIDRMHVSRGLDGADGQPGFDGMAAFDVQDPDGHFLGWAPGRGPIVAPEHLAWRLDRGADLIVELHLMPGAQPVAVQPSVGLFFTDQAPTKAPVVIVMGSKAIDISVGQRDYNVTDSYELPVDSDLLSLYPHAHYLGREMTVRAILPDGTRRVLLHIPQWNFQWQQDYRFVTPVPLPRGTTIALDYSYDNSDNNTNNPHRPLRRVTWGPQSTDEMANLGVQLLPRSTDDAAVLVKSFAGHAALIDVAGAEMLVRLDGNNAGHAALLGTSYIRVGRYTDAIPHLERALNLDPRLPNAENYLGGALLAQGRATEALAHFRRASALAPRDEHLHFNLARVLEGQGLAAEAVHEYRQAIAVNPDFAEAHQQLGVALFAQNRLPAALVHLQRAVELAPSSATAQSDLGGALAQAGQFDDARRHLRRALELDPQNAAARTNLERLQRP